MSTISGKKTHGRAVACKKTRAPRRAKETKKAKLISLLGKDRGADVGSLSKRLGWLPHTTRAALSGLRKSGYVITSGKSGNGKLRRYRITSLPAGQGA
mgnify:CR=1 FL=1|jgi:hypothetical protein